MYLFVAQLPPTNSAMLSVLHTKIRTNETIETCSSADWVSLLWNGEKASTAEDKPSSMWEINVTYLDRKCVTYVLHLFVTMTKFSSKRLGLSLLHEL